MTDRRYSPNANWNDLAELKCLYIVKALQEIGFPHGKRMEMCRNISSETGLSAQTLTAKVGNFMSEAGINNKSNSSKNTQYIYKKFGHLCSKKLKEIIKQ